MPTLGLLMLQTRFPRPLGDIGHAGTFAFAVRQRVVHGATPTAVVRGRDAALLQPFIEAGRALVAEGCDAIGTSCGFLARWQPELQAALPVPVWTSSLLQIAELPGRRCGVITIEAASLTADHLRAVGVDPATPVEGITPGSPLHCMLMQTCRRWTQPTRWPRCWQPQTGCARATRTSTRWCWSAPTCRPMPTRCAGTRGCRCGTW